MKIAKLSYALLCAATLTGTLAPTATTFASTTDQPTSVTATVGNNELATPDFDTTIVGKYVSLNKETVQFELSPDLLDEVSKEEYDFVVATIELSNAHIKAQLVAGHIFGIVDPTTGIEYAVYDGVLQPMIQERSGKDSFSIHWNYVHVGLSSETINAAIQAGGSAGGAILGGFLNFAGGEAIGAAIGAFIGSRFSHVTKGMWFDINTSSGKVTGFGYQ
ncbi:hypothetical protein [Lacticaseibacillus sp. N501-2]|uniref:hypothetical protein n=1 Tax=Lacticaseibacillus salsurae TaxID=3367729 RepID=UPI0038B2F0CB